jgi:hypothetical protein
VGLAGGYILAATPLHVEALRANPRLNRWIKDVFFERLLLLNRTVDLAKVTEEIEKQGYLPRVSSDTLHVTGEGLFHVTMRPEELYELIATLMFCLSLEDDFGAVLFENRVQSLLERLSRDLRETHGSSAYIETLRKAFQSNFEKAFKQKRDDEKRKLKKQVNRLINRLPRDRPRRRYQGENPTSDGAGILKMLRFAIEHEKQVKIHYLRSTGERVDEVIEPESLQAGRVYGYCPDHDEHHIYSVKRIEQAAI